ncbi:hypothetical protein BAY61_25910 [Prauserella marina]|uniref:Uncharacterized protein n=1 Tax=Prauserella marina TaxID=530584 RepID=A0A222VVL8_9PSEU|nr:hypothetical protein [Prauserella marina]ASR37872.1 hypothetical protein BAY61_25910 [Prauserella marina]PWV73072.1 hypothetical protein DES30_10921 [Prauserella marina]SDD72571.1 hypothetical protein SAMN05421630_111252 [Prauserella marina]
MGHVHADRTGGEQEPLVEKAQRALIAMRFGDDVEALDALAPSSTGQLADTRAMMMLLFGECSSMVSTLGDGGSAPVKVQVFDEAGEEVSIDQADPPVRTAVRTLLAEVHGNTEAAEEQVEIALASAAPEEVASLAIQALRWTMRLSTECLERDLPVAPWIAAAFAD